MKKNDKEKNDKWIFIIDDDPWSNLLMQKMLEAIGYNVKAFTNGRDLLLMIRHQRPDLLISDIDMPEMDGFELYKEIKDNPENRFIPFVYATAFSETEVKEKAKKLGAAYLKKPVSKKILMNAVSDAINR